MLSQSLLFCDWRDCAAPPDSSASSQALTTEGSRPVLAARREANCCWPEVSMVWALPGREAPPVVKTPVAELLCWAWASASAKLVDVEPPAAVVLVPETPCDVAAATDGSNAV